MAIYRKWPLIAAHKVISPEYCTSFGGYDPPEPPEYSCDYIEIIGESSKRKAVIKGVKLILSNCNSSYAADNRSDGLSPFTGYRAERIWLWDGMRVL